MKFVCGGSGSDGNAYALISESGEILLIECGVPWKKILRMINYRVSDIVGCIVTHRHSDHVACYAELLKIGIKIYTNDETANHFGSVNGGRMLGIPEKKPVTIGSFRATPFYVPHTTRDPDTGEILPCPNYGYLIHHDEVDMLYATDFEYLAYTFRNQKLNAMVLECNHDNEIDNLSPNYEHVLRGHSSLSVVKDIVRANITPMLQNIILCHLSDENADEPEMVRQVQEVAGSRVNVAVAKAGMKSLELLRTPF